MKKVRFLAIRTVALLPQTTELTKDSEEKEISTFGRLIFKNQARFVNAGNIICSSRLLLRWKQFIISEFMLYSRVRWTQV
jgi:hypothetical protein